MELDSSFLGHGGESTVSRWKGRQGGEKDSETIGANLAEAASTQCQ